MKKEMALVLSTFLLWGGATPAEASSQPSIEGNGGLLIEANSNKILYSKNPYQKMPMASTTKILTAIIAIEKGKLDDIVTVPHEASVVEGSQVWLEDGEKQKLIDLLYALMLRSGNDAAISIANHIGKTVEGFSKMMNEKARDIGAKSSSFMNPHGLDDPNHYTTAYDLGLISAYAMRNPTFRKIVATKRWNMPWPGHEYDRLLINKNKMLYNYSDAVGVKTGYTKKTGRCLVSAAERNKMLLVSVVLKDYNWWEDSRKLLDYGFENYSSKEILSPGQIKAKVKVSCSKMKNVVCTNEKGCNLVQKKDSSSSMKYNFKIKIPKEVKAPIKKGETLGKVTIFIDGKLYRECPLVAEDDIKAQSSVNCKSKGSFANNFIKILKTYFN